MKSNRAKTTLNILMNILSYGINIFIGFVLTSRIISMLSGEAYGYITLSNSMTNYFTVITVALNSLAGRFIAVKVHEGRIEEAKSYFATTFYANLFFTLIIAAASMVFIPNLEKFIVIPSSLVGDVKWLFVFTVANFCCSLLSTAFSTSLFITNQLYKSTAVQMVLALLRALLLYAMYFYYIPKVSYWGLANLLICVITLFVYIYYCKCLTPDLKIKWKYCKRSVFITLIRSGIWNTVSKVGQVLSDGLDLLITNLWINTIAMGQLSIAKSLLTYVTSLMGTITSAFCPDLTQKYAEGRKYELVESLKCSMRLSGFFMNLPLLLIVLWGREFFSLWVPGEDSQMLQILAFLTIQGSVVSGTTTNLNNVFTITNKIKRNALVWLAISFIDIGIVALLLNSTNLGVYAVAGVSTGVGCLVNLIFVPIDASKCLEVSPITFYPTILRYSVTTILTAGILLFVKEHWIYFLNVDSWGRLIGICAATVIFVLCINYYAVLMSHERKILVNIVNKSITKLRNRI